MDFGKVAEKAEYHGKERKAKPGLIPGALVIMPLDVIKAQVKAEEVSIALDKSMEAVKALVVQDQESAARIIDIAAGAKKAAKAIDMALKVAIQEPEGRIKDAKSFAKTFTEKAETIEKEAKGKVIAFQQAERIRLERERQEAQKRQDEINRKLGIDALREIAKSLGYESQEEIDAVLTSKEYCLIPLDERFPGDDPIVFAQARQALIDHKNVKPEDVKDVAFEVAPQVNLPTAPDTPTLIRTEGGAKSSTAMVWTFDIEDANAIPRDYLCVDEKKIRDAVRLGTREIPGVKIYQKEQIRIG